MLGRTRVRWRVCAGLALLLARDAGAQWGVWPADSLLAEGRLAAAESVYYAAVRQHPRDPLARAALGRFLSARGGARA
ncbi:MAG: tetratricopeptide repeat protein, partial [Gemmatimonadaceae bacterium]